MSPTLARSHGASLSSSRLVNGGLQSRVDEDLSLRVLIFAPRPVIGSYLQLENPHAGGAT